ncbi:hypothetical protein F5X97DRAFT_292128 [Nemania serpens]|nr:hypothetical protein F5X97DRAFT_292128 [Nemania serpens]
MESPSLSASDDRALPCMADAGIPASSNSSSVDLLANLPDPPNLADLSGPGGSCNRPTSPTQAFQASREDDDSLTTLPDRSQKKKDAGSDVALVTGDHDASLRPDKGKAPASVHLLFDSDKKPSMNPYEVASIDVQQAHHPSDSVIGYDPLATSSDPIETDTADTAEKDETSSPDTQLELQYTKSPSNPLDEAHDYNSATALSAPADRIELCKKKQDEKADPQTETASSSKTLQEEKPFQPLSFGDPGWEQVADRPPQKLPIRFRDAVGRNYVFPWEKAKTWTVSDNPLLSSSLSLYLPLLLRLGRGEGGCAHFILNYSTFF